MSARQETNRKEGNLPKMLKMLGVSQRNDSDFGQVCHDFVSAIAEEVYDRSDDFRVTLFTSDDDPDHISPSCRWQSGEVIPLHDPRVRFSKGVPVAGKAWQEPKKVFVLELPDFSTDDQVEEFYTELGLPPENAKRFRVGQMKDFRSVLCLGLHDSKNDPPVVLSVDSRLRDGFVEKSGTEMRLKNPSRLRATIKRFMPRLQRAIGALQPSCKASP